MLMGISLDEIRRMKPSRLPYIENIFPLIDLRMRRRDCFLWMESHGYPIPPRSACTFCPYHSRKEWRNIKSNQEDWVNLIKFDKAIRINKLHFSVKKGKNLDDRELFLTKDCIPIDEIDLRTSEELGQGNLFDNECEGMCGV